MHSNLPQKLIKKFFYKTLLGFSLAITSKFTKTSKHQRFKNGGIIGNILIEEDTDSQLIVKII
jgi:hypothetical protein